MTRWMAACMALAFSLSAWAGAKQPELYLAEGSGQLTIDPQGAVLELTTQPSFGAKLDAVLRERMRSWRFEPILENGQAVTAVAHMQFELRAEFDVGRTGRVVVSRLDFVDPPELRAAKDEATWGPTKMTPPRYPMRALERRLGARTVVQVEIDDQGRALHAEVLSGWLLGDAGGARSQQKAMELFAKTSLKAVQDWQFPTPEQLGSRLLQVPISYLIDDGSHWKRAHWVERKPQQLLPAQAATAVQFDAGGRRLREDVRLLSDLDEDLNAG